MGNLRFLFFSIKINVSLESFNSEKEIWKKNKYSPRKWDDRFPPGVQVYFWLTANWCECSHLERFSRERLFMGSLHICHFLKRSMSVLLCSQGMSVYDLFLSLEPGFLSYYFAMETHRLRKCPWARKRQEKLGRGNAPINSKLQYTPRAYPGHLTVHCARGKGNLNVALEGWGIWTGFVSCSDVIGLWICSVFVGLTDLQDRISPLLANNSLKRVFKRRLKVSLRHISLSERHVNCLIEDQFCLWGEAVQY